MQENLRHVPLGWSESHDFNDMASAFSMIDTWFAAVVWGKENSNGTRHLDGPIQVVIALSSL